MEVICCRLDLWICNACCNNLCLDYLQLFECSLLLLWQIILGLKQKTKHNLWSPSRIELGTSCAQSENHTTRPNAVIMLLTPVGTLDCVLRSILFRCDRKVFTLFICQLSWLWIPLCAVKVRISLQQMIKSDPHPLRNILTPIQTKRS